MRRRANGKGASGRRGRRRRLQQNFETLATDDGDADGDADAPVGEEEEETRENGPSASLVALWRRHSASSVEVSSPRSSSGASSPRPTSERGGGERAGGSDGRRGEANGMKMMEGDGHVKKERREEEAKAEAEARRRSPGERRLTYAPCGAWAAALAAGTFAPGARNGAALAAATARTKWFDDVFTSAWGPALPLTCMFARWAAAARVYARDAGERVPLGTCAHIRRDLEAYVFVALTRLCAYVAFTRLWPSAFMSDHVFLGASVFTAIHGEVLSCAVDFLILVERREKPLRRTAIMCVAMYGLACMACVLSEVFVTARFYHRGLETACAAFFGWFVLQLPLVFAVVRPRARGLAAALAL